MAGEVKPDGSIVFTGPPIPPALQQVFQDYGGRRAVTGVVVLTKAIRVEYDNGALALDFVPVFPGERPE